MNLGQQKIILELDQEERELSDQKYRILSKVTQVQMGNIANIFSDFYNEHGIAFNLTRNDTASSPQYKRWAAIHAGKEMADLTIWYRSEIQSVEFKIYDENYKSSSYYIHADYFVELPNGQEVIANKKVTTIEEISEQEAESLRDPIEAKRNKNEKTKLINSLLETTGKYKFYYNTGGTIIYISDWKDFISKFYN